LIYVNKDKTFLVNMNNVIAAAIGVNPREIVFRYRDGINGTMTCKSKQERDEEYQRILDITKQQGGDSNAE
jgi:hypothetical protein